MKSLVLALSILIIPACKSKGGRGDTPTGNANTALPANTTGSNQGPQGSMPMGTDSTGSAGGRGSANGGSSSGPTSGAAGSAR